jgi:hypothetical protein
MCHRGPLLKQDPRELEVMEEAAAAVAGKDWGLEGARGRAPDPPERPGAAPKPMQTDDAGGETERGQTGALPSSFAQFMSESDSSSSDSGSDSEEDILAPLAEDS